MRLYAFFACLFAFSGAAAFATDPQAAVLQQDIHLVRADGAFPRTLRVPDLMNRDSSFKIKMGASEVPMMSTGSGILKFVRGREAVRLACTNQFTGEVGRANFLTQTGGDTLTLDFGGDTKYTVNVKAAKRIPRAKTKEEILGEPNGLYSRFARPVYQKIQDECIAQSFVEAGLDIKNQIKMSNHGVEKFNILADCFNAQIESSNFYRASCAGEKCASLRPREEDIVKIAYHIQTVHNCCGNAPCRAEIQKQHRIELIPAANREIQPEATGKTITPAS